MAPPSGPDGRLRENVRDEVRRTGGGSAPIDSETLLGSAETLQINHNGHIYTLRKTRNGKLILTK